MEPQPEPEKRRVALLGSLLVAALALRWGLAAADPPIPRNPDAVDYDELARSLSSGRGYTYAPGDRSTLLASFRDRAPVRDWREVPTALRPPLYPVFLSLVYRVSSSGLFVALVQGLLGTLSVWFLYRAARALISDRAALIVAGAAAVYPFFLYFGLERITEGLFVPLLSAFLWALAVWVRDRTWRPLAAAGLLQGAMILTRPQALFYVPAVLAVLIAASDAGVKRTARAAALYLGVAAAVLVPWTARNARVFGEFIPLSTLGGFNFWLGNAWYGERGSHQDFYWSDLGGTLHEIQGKTEPEVDRHYYAKARAYVRDHPFRCARAYAQKLWDLWRPAPHFRFYSAGYLAVALVAVVPLYLAAFGGAVWGGLSRPARWLLVGSVLSYTLAAAIHVPTLRHRAAGIDPVLLLLAGAGIDRLAAVLAPRFRRPA